MKVHKVGTITFGCVLILFGVLLFVHMFFPAVSYELIFHLWPCVLILLGIEVLLSNFACRNVTFTYDKTSVVLLVILTFFSMIMAWADMAMQYQQQYWSMYW